MFVVVALAALLMIGVASAFAAAPVVVGPPGSDNPNEQFLCPSVGKGVLNHRPDAGQLPNGSYTFLPGNNQSGLHANPNAYNGDGGPGDSPGPGNGNSNWSPIWDVSGGG